MTSYPVIALSGLRATVGMYDVYGVRHRVGFVATITLPQSFAEEHSNPHEDITAPQSKIHGEAYPLWL